MAKDKNSFFEGAVVVIIISVVIFWAAPSAFCQSGFRNPNYLDNENIMNENEAVQDEMVGENTSTEMGFFQEAITGNTISIPIAAFSSDGIDPDGFFKSFSGGYIYGNESSNVCLSAPIIFPKTSSTIAKVIFYAHDFNATSSENFSVYSLKLKDGTNTNIGSVNTVDSSGISAYSIVPSPADILPGNTYTITTCVRPDIRFYGVRVKYTN
jgi:hypothetical protein